jgi:hypothetical protein
MYEYVSDQAPFIFCTGVVVLMAFYAWFTAPRDRGGGRNDAVAGAVAKDKPPQ